VDALKRHSSPGLAVCVAMSVLCVSMVAGALVNPAQAGASPPEVATLLQDVTAADGHSYGTVDDQHVGMDTAKIIADPRGGYLAVSHHLIGPAFQVRLATSTDLLNWHHVAVLDNDASQPTLASLSDGGFVVGYEKKGAGTACGGSGSCLAFRHYADTNALMAGTFDKAIVLNRTLSSCNEGTPNIYAATLNPDIGHSIINVGFHYYSGCTVDREASGTLTNMSSWKVQTDANLNTLFANLGGINGNVGDRDGFYYQGRPYSLIEAQYTKNDYASWRPYLFDRTRNSLTLLTLHTNAGSTAFGNPTFTDLALPSGKQGFVATQFIFSEGAAAGEAGSLVYYRQYPLQAAQDTTPPTVSITQPATGSRVARLSTVSIKASAADDVGVAKVAVYVNGVLTCVSPFAPYACTWTVPNRSGAAYTITASAFDTASNTSTASVQVTAR
jgi:Bacterial Ig domain